MHGEPGTARSSDALRDESGFRPSFVPSADFDDIRPFKRSSWLGRLSSDWSKGGDGMANKDFMRRFLGSLPMSLFGLSFFGLNQFGLSLLGLNQFGLSLFGLDQFGLSLFGLYQFGLTLFGLWGSFNGKVI